MLIPEITDSLLERLDLFKINPAHILIYGEQTDRIKTALQQRYPTSHIQTASALITLNTHQNNSIDFIISSFALHLEPEPTFLLNEFFRILKINGLLLFSTLGPDSFLELRKNSRDTNGLVDMHHIGDWLKELRFNDPVMDMEKIILAYDSLDLLFQDFHYLQKLEYNPQFKTADYFPLTLEVLYGHAWKTELPTESDEVAIPVSAIKRNKNK